MSLSKNNPKFGTVYITADTFDELRSIQTTDIVAGSAAIVKGALQTADGLGGFYAWVPGLNDPDDDEQIIASSDGQSGRWVKLAVGQRGAQGVQGIAGTLTIDSVTTTLPGTTATVTNTGSASAAHLNITVPRGDRGDAATIALGTVSTGAPGSAASVTNSGDSAHAIFDIAIPQGLKGDAATIAVGTVSTGAPGSAAVVQNAGNSSNALLNLTIPRGDTGAKGDKGDLGSPTGGATGQVLAKKSNTDFDAQWITLANYLAGSGLSLTGATFSVDTSIIASVSALMAGLATKANTSHTHDASAIVSGTIDPARLPATVFQPPIVATGDLTTLTTAQQANIRGGSVVITSDGLTRYYSGSGDKTVTASYTVGADSTPDFSTIANKPTTLAGYGITDATSSTGTIPASRMPAFTGDASSTTGTSALTLATVNANTGTFGSSAAVPVITTDGKGRVTAVSTAALGTAATVNTGTSGATIPLLSTANTWTLGQTFTGAITANNFSGSSSGTNTGDQTNITGNAGTATKLAATRTLGITGDLSWTLPFDGSTSVSAVGTLATVNTNTGSYGSATQAPTFTVNGKGLLTAAGAVTITPAWSSVTGKPTTIAGYGITDAVTLTGSGANGTWGISVTGTAGNANALSGYGIGTSGSTVPLLSTANTWSSAQAFNAGASVAATGLTFTNGFQIGSGVSSGLYYDTGSVAMRGLNNSGATLYFQSYNGTTNYATMNANGITHFLAVTNNSTNHTIANGSFNYGKDNQLLVNDYDGGIEIGKTGRAAAGAPYFDFHSSANSTDFDVRMMVTGGSSSGSGQGDMTITAATFQTSGPHYINNRAGSCHLRLQDSGGYAAIQFGNSTTASNNNHIISTGGGEIEFYSGVWGSGTFRGRVNGAGGYTMAGTTLYFNNNAGNYVSNDGSWFRMSQNPLAMGAGYYFNGNGGQAIYHDGTTVYFGGASVFQPQATVNFDNDKWHQSRDGIQRFYYANGSNTYYNATLGAQHVFRIGQTDRLRINQDGNLSFCASTIYFNDNGGWYISNNGSQFYMSQQLNVSGSVTSNRNPFYLGGQGDQNHCFGNGLDNYNGSADGESWNVWQFGLIRAKQSNNVALFVEGRGNGNGFGNNGFTGFYNVTDPRAPVEVGGTIQANGMTGNGSTGDFGGQFRAVSGNRVVMFRNDGANFYLLFSDDAGSNSAARNATWNGYRPFAFGWNGNVQLNAEGGSDTYCGRNLYASDVQITSDRRLKKNIRTIDNALEKVCAMRGTYFDKKTLATDVYTPSSGVIAQELEEVAPEKVVTMEDGYKTVGDLDGYLIEAIKELVAKVEALEGRSA